jgi:hypothetical protein
MNENTNIHIEPLISKAKRSLQETKSPGKPGCLMANIDT